MNVSRLYTWLLVGYWATSLHAQTPVPAPAQTANILIIGATAHLGNGQVVEQSAIAFEQGKISFVADSRTIRIDQSKYTQIFDGQYTIGIDRSGSGTRNQRSTGSRIF
jgi:hypothetical protein